MTSIVDSLLNYISFINIDPSFEFKWVDEKTSMIQSKKYLS